MNTNSTTVFAVVACVASACLIACAASAPDTGSGGAAVTNGDRGTSGGAATKASPKTSDAGGEGGASAATCGKMATINQCTTCCTGVDFAKTKIHDDAIQACMCKAATAKCSPADGQATCNNEPTSDQCNIGEDAYAQCSADAKKACDADPTCAAAEKCLDDANCDSLKGDDDDTGTDTVDPGTSGSSSSGSSGSSGASK